MDRLKQDLRYALRAFARTPAFTAAAVLSIAMHASDHYGQMAMYLRMNGIVPPASR